MTKTNSVQNGKIQRAIPVTASATNTIPAIPNKKTARVSAGPFQGSIPKVSSLWEAVATVPIPIRNSPSSR